jgi:hypothetical protein
MRMRVSVQLKLPEALALQAARPATPALQQVLQILRDIGGQLRPVHPGATDPLLAPYFTVDVASRAIADDLVRRLLACEAVVAAYVEPSIAPP